VTKQEIGRLCQEKGYSWCEECLALTPHIKLDDWNTGCSVCETRKIEGWARCPVCGWEPPEDMFTEPEGQSEQIHLPGCHDSLDAYGSTTNGSWVITQRVLDEREWARVFSEQGIYSRYRELMDMECGCPKVMTYKYPWLIAHRASQRMSYVSPYSYHLEWDIRCPICGEIFEVDDITD